MWIEIKPKRGNENHVNSGSHTDDETCPRVIRYRCECLCVVFCSNSHSFHLFLIHHSYYSLYGYCVMPLLLLCHAVACTHTHAQVKKGVWTDDDDDEKRLFNMIIIMC